MNNRKSGVNLHLSLVGETYDGTYVGTQETDALQQVPLTWDLVPPPSGGFASVPCWQVLVQADPSNATNVLVGDEAHGCHIVLRAGESIMVPVNDVNKVYVRTADGGGTNVVNWFAMT